MRIFIQVAQVKDIQLADMNHSEVSSSALKDFAQELSNDNRKTFSKQQVEQAKNSVRDQRLRKFQTRARDHFNSQLSEMFNRNV